MNEKEISEIRRRFRADKSNITHVRGCYVNEKQEIVSQFDQPLSLLPQEECENMLSVLRRTARSAKISSKCRLRLRRSLTAMSTGC